MSEMISGNTGTRDESLNIDMENSLYYKVQGISEIKSVLKPAKSEHDKSFAFIGRVSDTSGEYSVYGYNAKLENDIRGGDYCHYIAVPLNEKMAGADFANAKFFSEKGFIEYAANREVSDENRFCFAPQEFEIAENAKKLLVNNILEVFTRQEKRKKVHMCFKEESVSVFSAKSIYALNEIMKYLPYAMRKNIAFLSRIELREPIGFMSYQEIPSMMNLAAYPTVEGQKSLDCIDLEDNSVTIEDGMFEKYVEKVFAMDDAAREQYLEKLYNDIEAPASKKDIDIKSDLYLIDVETMPLWKEGDAAEAVESIFESYDDILNMYDAYLDVAKTRLASGIEDSVKAYINGCIGNVGRIEDLSDVYNAIKAVVEKCALDVNEYVVLPTRAQVSSLIKTAATEADVIKTADSAYAINADIVDEEAVKEVFGRLIAEKKLLKDLNAFYFAVCEKAYINNEWLNANITAQSGAIITMFADMFKEIKDKLNKAKGMYADFKAICSTKMCELIPPVCEEYIKKYEEATVSDKYKKDFDTIKTIKAAQFNANSLAEIADYITKLSKIEVSADPKLKEETEDCYKTVGGRFFAIIRNNEYKMDYNGLEEFINQSVMGIKILEAKGVRDGIYRQRTFSSGLTPNSMSRTIFLVKELMVNLKEQKMLVDALRVFKMKTAKLEPEEMQDGDVRKALEKLGKIAFANWCQANPNLSAADYKKAEKKLAKKYRISLDYDTKKIYEECADIPRKEEKRKKKKKRAIIIGFIAVVLALLLGIAGAVIGICNLFGLIGEKEQQEPASVITDQQTDPAQKNYTIQGTCKLREDGTYEITIADKGEHQELTDTIIAEKSDDTISLEKDLMYDIDVMVAALPPEVDPTSKEQNEKYYIVSATKVENESDKNSGTPGKNDQGNKKEE